MFGPGSGRMKVRSTPRSLRNTTEEIIQRFAAKEKEFKEARDQYTYRQTVKVKTPDAMAEYHEVST